MYLLNRILVLFSFFLMASCQNEDSKNSHSSDNILSKEQMVEFLIDLHMTESNISSMNYNRDSSMKLFNTIDESLYSKYNTSDSIVQRSLKYYAQNPELYDQIYEDVLDSLSVIQTTGIYKP